MNRFQKPDPIGLYEVLASFVVLTSFAFIALLWLNRFHSLPAVLAGGFAALLISWLVARGRGFTIRDRRFGWEILPILAVALAFRLQPSVYVVGGQDQGVYMIMSSYLDRAGQTSMHDSVRDRFVAAGLENYYDLTNQVEREVRISGRYEGSHKAGIIISSLEKSEYVFLFYPLHAAWLAASGKVWGDKYRILSVVAFSFLSLLSLYLLTGLISPVPRFTSGVVTLLLAISPAHIYFSRFPLSEMMALALISTSLYFLLKGYRRRDEGTRADLEFFLSWGLFTAYFFTRISGFLWLPFFYSLSLLALFAEKSPAKRWALVKYSFAVVASYAASVVYGFIHSFPYSWDIYRWSLPKPFIDHWQSLLPLGSLLAIAVPVAVSAAVRGNPRWRAKSISLARASRYLAFAAFALMLLACVWVFRDIWLHPHSTPEKAKYIIGEAGFAAAQQASIWVDFIHLSPPIFLAFLAGTIYLLTTSLPEHGLLLLILAVAWYYAGYKQEFMGYQYYTLRYQIMELIPFSIMTAGIVLSAAWLRGVWPRRLVYVAIAWACVSSLIYDRALLKGREMQGLNKSLQTIASTIHPDALVLLWQLDGRFGDLHTPLRYYYDLNAILIRSPEDLVGPLAPVLRNWPGKVMILTTDISLNGTQVPLIGAPRGFPVELGKLEQSPTVPRKYETISSQFFLMEVDRHALRAGEAVFFGPRSEALSPAKSLDGKEIRLQHLGLKKRGEASDRYVVSLALKEHCIQPVEAHAQSNGQELRPKPASDKTHLTWYVPARNETLDVLTLTGVTGLDPSCILSVELSPDRFVVYPRLLDGEAKLDGFFPDFHWTEGNPVISKIKASLESYHWLVIHTHGSHPFLQSHPERIRPRAMINGISIGEGQIRGKNIWFKIPPSIRSAETISFEFGTFIPKAEGMGEDNRALGLDILSVNLQ